MIKLLDAKSLDLVSGGTDCTCVHTVSSYSKFVDHVFYDQNNPLDPTQQYTEKASNYKECETKCCKHQPIKDSESYGYFYCNYRFIFDNTEYFCPPT
jgi:hypothetical protein